MSLPILALLAALAGDPAPWFPRLEADASADRDLAQHRVAAELGPGDLALVRAALVAGGPETRLRLAAVLAEEDRLFGIAAELAADPDVVVARAGSDALQQAIERFEPWQSSTPIPRDQLATALVEHVLGPIDARATRPFEPDEIADLLARAQPSAPRIVLDTAPRSGSGARKALEVGSWRELARNVAQQSGGQLVGYGLRREPAPFAVRWLAVVERGASDEALRSGALVERWCTALARAGDPASRAAAARAICAHGMPTAVAWIERRFRDARDDAALEGLLLAARRGDAPAVLQEPFAREHLWSELEGRACDPSPRALHAALALAAVGSPRGEGREVELARALADADPAAPRRAYLALVVLEGWASPRAPERFGSAIRGLLARADLEIALRFQALRVASRLGVVEPIAGDPAALVLAAHASGHFDELARLLRGAPGWPPAAWSGDGLDPTLEVVLRGPERLELGERSLALVDGWLAHGEIDAAARSLARLIASAPRATEGVRELARAEPAHAEAGVAATPLRAAVQRAAASRSLAPEESATWLVACGVATAGERRDVLARLSARAPAGELERLALADLCAGPTGPDARARFVETLRDSEPGLALAAAQRAVRALRADLDDAAERAFVQSIRGVVRAERGGPLDLAFRSESWPPPPTASPRSLRSFDRDRERGPR